ncbi:basic membrane lipoprotein Med (substrate-binding protein (PBP1-ABC) superfamily) [Oxalobacteraceae bacterium GrIS 1.11]
MPTRLALHGIPRRYPSVLAKDAITRMGRGADVLTHHTDSTAVVQAAEEKGKYAITCHSDMKKYGPKAQLAAVTHHWGAYYTQQAQAVIDGKSVTWAASRMAWSSWKPSIRRCRSMSGNASRSAQG